MTEALKTFLVGFLFSFLGSIPPGTINLTVLQVGLSRKISIAWRLALAAAVVEYAYAGIAVEFTSLILSSPQVINNLRIITGLVMIILGAFNFWSASKPSGFSRRFDESGFRRGLLLGVLNPMGIPFWIAMTTYLQTQHWIDLSTSPRLHSYLLGVSLGGFVLLIVLAYLATQLARYFQHNLLVKRIPGIVLMLLGLYSFFQLL